jgi:hypothetical protein
VFDAQLLDQLANLRHHALHHSLGFDNNSKLRVSLDLIADYLKIVLNFLGHWIIFD